jgi:BatD DUF11 like domain
LKHAKFIDIDTILRFRFAVLLLTVLPMDQTLAQVKFTTVASSNQIGRGDYVQVEYVVENAHQIQGLSQPNFADFRIVQGPIQSSGMSVVNGLTSQYQGLSFVLQPLRIGKFTIPGASATVDGKLMHSNAVTIVVSANSSPNPNGNNIQPFAPPSLPDPMDVDREYLLRPGEKAADKIRKNIFVQVQVSKTDCYVGEPIVATYKLYSRLQSESRVTKHPSLNGFSVFDMVDPTKDNATVETVDGRPFTVHVIRKAQLIPLIAGKIDLDPMEVDNTIHFVKTSSTQRAHHTPGSLQDLFDRFSEEEQNETPIEQEVTLQSKPVSISVKALPEENIPGDFNGAVGHYTLETSTENKPIAAREAAVLRVKLKGDGNLPLVNAPAINWPTGFASYDASSSEEIDKTVAPLRGTKTFQYSFIPKLAGSYVLPAVSFSYFDPQAGMYKTVQSKPLNIQVGAPSRMASHVRSVVSGSLPMTGVSGWFSRNLPQHLAWLLAVMLLAALAVYLFIRNKLLARGPSGLSQTKQTQVTQAVLAPAPDPLARARRYFEYNEYKNFYHELYRAISEAVETKLNLPGSKMNKQQMTLKLRQSGWDDQAAAMLEKVLSECEIKLYSPAYHATDMQRILQEAEQIMAGLERV